MTKKADRAVEVAPVRISPEWVETPGLDDMDELYPPRAKARGIVGRVGIRCSVEADGRLKSCVVEKEEPAGEGFGEASVRAAALFRMKPTTPDGAPVAGGAVRVTLGWTLGD